MKSGVGRKGEGKILRKEYDEIVEDILNDSDKIDLTIRGVLWNVRRLIRRST